MKRLSIFLALLTSVKVFCINDIDTIRLKTNITNVTVFYNGAQITRNAQIKANKGKHLIIIDSLTKEVNPQSIQVEGIEKCLTLSVKHQLIFPVENKKSSAELEIEKKIELQTTKIKEINNRIKVFILEEKLLLDNSILSKKDDGSKISDIKDAADFYRIRLNEINQGKLIITAEKEEIIKNIKELYSKLNELAVNRQKTYSQILITVDCEQNVNTTFTMSYQVSSAGWTPIYDFRVNDISKPLNIVYNANVFQSSGENWENVKMTLSTNNPSLSGNKPELSNWYLDRRNYQRTTQQQTYPTGTLRISVFDTETKEPIPFANITVEIDGKLIAGSATDLNGICILRSVPVGRVTVKASSIGYTTQQINSVLIIADQVRYLDVPMSSGLIRLDEVVDYKVPLIFKEDTQSGGTITRNEIYKMSGRPQESFAGYDDKYSTSSSDSRSGGKRPTSGNYMESASTPKPSDDYVTTNFISNTIKTNITNLEFKIDIPYNIPSDGKDCFIKIKETSLPVKYIYYAVPKLDKDVFLTAEITDWTELNLLSGKTNIYYQGTFTGESFIDTEQTSDTLKVSLGRDRNIIVQRESDKKIYDKKFIGNNIKETTGYEITVRNNKNSKIRIIVEDQFPLSEKKTIEVERLDFSKAKLDSKTGKLIWELDLEPNEKQVVSYKYSVKYPNYLRLNLE